MDRIIGFTSTMGDYVQDNHNYPEMSPRNRTRSFVYIAILLAFLIYLVMNAGGFASKDKTVDIATSEFVAAVKEDRVTEVTYKVETRALDGKFYENSAAKDAGKISSFHSTYVGEDNLNELMARHSNVKFVVDTSNSDLWQTLLISVLPTVIILGVILYFMNQMQGQNGKALNFGRTKARMEEDGRPQKKFADVAGIDEVVEELKEVRDFLAEPDRFTRMGAKIPRGVLLVGPPGTGKTLLARAVAGEADVPFFSISGSDFVEMFVGVGASRVRDLFKQAKEAAPCIIFIDEIDAVGRQRGAGLGGGHDEREQTLNQLLVEMDGFEDNSSVILIAATNRPDILDPALLRPGRFDRQITVDRPDVKGREQILRVHSQNKPLAQGVNFEALAKLTPGFTGADLANLMNEGALLAARRHKDTITMAEIEEAMERVIAGPEKKARVMTETERKTIAYHECGHALVGHILENSDPVHKISVIARGQALGYTLSLPEEDRFLETRNGMFDQIAVLLGGRTAEELFCDDITTGASNDLERATKMAREMVTRYGMSEELGTQVYGEAQHEVFLGRDYTNHNDLSAETAKRIDDEVERIMREAHERARSVLEARREQMHTMASVLLERETVEGDIVNALLDDTWDEYLAAHPEEAAGRGRNQQKTSEAPVAAQTQEASAPQHADEHDGAPKSPADLTAEGAAHRGDGPIPPDAS
ncbi:MAG: ATP-dependent zinc metalloprotease FtsH [Coriobacteriales bacterium]|nr:ATP-dependent zinc metalloprotease FtsH [Coriobacteriales bacterium]